LKESANPFVESLSEPTLMILDMFSAHTCVAVIRAFNMVGTEVEVLPGGCTSCVQPIDNGINKPVKDYARRLYSDHKIRSIEEHDKVIAPSRQQVARWISDSWTELTTEIVLKSWKTRVPYYWFENENMNLE